MNILLDTHTVLWWDNDQLPGAVTKRIQRADRVYVSAVSASLAEDLVLVTADTSMAKYPVPIVWD